MNWSDVGKKLKEVAGAALPVVGTALGGPAGAAVGALLAKELGVDPSPASVDAAITPGNIVKLKQIEADLKKAQLESASQERIAQMEVNKVEAGSSSLFNSGWRPAVGWICALAFFWSFILAPFISYVAVLCGFVGKLPVLDLSQLMPVLLGMLGLGGLRTYEVVKGKTRGV